MSHRASSFGSTRGTSLSPSTGARPFAAVRQEIASIGRLSHSGGGLNRSLKHLGLRIGRLSGFTPLRMRSAKRAERRCAAETSELRKDVVDRKAGSWPRPSICP